MVLGPDDKLLLPTPLPVPAERLDDPMGVENALVPPLERSGAWYWEVVVVWIPDEPDNPGEPYELGTCLFEPAPRD